jgi:hypothetical protein
VHQAKNGKIWVDFGQEWLFFNFLQKNETVTFFNSKGKFWTVFGKNGQNGIFFKNLKKLILCEKIHFSPL